MGNCMWRAFSGPARSETVRVVTSTGGIMELQGSVTAERITNEFPGHGIFRRRRSSHPLLHNEPLLAGHLYYLLPLDHRVGCSSPTDEDDDAATSPLNAINSALTPYRMSLDNHVFGRWRRPAGAEGLPLCQKATPAMWKVRLVISPEQLSRILAEESHTQVLIESVRTVAKCSAGCPLTAQIPMTVAPPPAAGRPLIMTSDRIVGGDQAAAAAALVAVVVQWVIIIVRCRY